MSNTNDRVRVAQGIKQYIESRSGFITPLEREYLQRVASHVADILYPPFGLDVKKVWRTMDLELATVAAHVIETDPINVSVNVTDPVCVLRQMVKGAQEWVTELRQIVDGISLVLVADSNYHGWAMILQACSDVVDEFDLQASKRPR